ncbi:MAG: hypothetical protein SPK31_03225 [Alloprevotella sp.]|nr:hypothetical protein [Prevotellamassilia sp.]MDY5762096.1 hypothetical protein [Alloprevotella sp.]
MTSKIGLMTSKIGLMTSKIGLMTRKIGSLSVNIWPKPWAFLTVAAAKKLGRVCHPSIIQKNDTDCVTKDPVV